MQFSSIWSGRFALVLAALLALLIAWSLVRLAWLVVDGPGVEPAPMPPVPRAAPQAGVNGDFRWELFGSGQTTPAALLQAAPATRLALKLKGVVAVGDAGYAIIADSDGEDRLYRVGDELSDGARVEAIEARRVLLDHDGQTEALEMETAQTTLSGRRTTAGRGAGREPLQLAGIRGLESGSGIPGGIASMPEVASLGSANLQELAGAISVLPVSGGGFRVRPGRDARLFTDLGLQVNDVVTAINGQPLESEDDVRALFGDIMRRGEVSITINRQGREMTLRPDLEDILGRLQ